jgi:tRNA1(Val) A37 N6-methylase TrmN6
VYPSPTKNSSLVIIQARKNSKSPLIFTPPLINFSDEVEAIYKKANTYTLRVDLENFEEFLD